MGSDVTFGTIKKLSRKKKSKMGTKIMSLNGVCICRRLCCVIPEVLKKNKMKMKISSHILLLHFERKKKNPAAYNMRIMDSMCIHSQTVLLMYHLLRTT